MLTSLLEGVKHHRVDWPRVGMHADRFNPGAGQLCELVELCPMVIRGPEGDVVAENRQMMPGLGVNPIQRPPRRPRRIGKVAAHQNLAPSPKILQW